MLDQFSVKLEDFRGLFKNEDAEMTPQDHFQESMNLSHLLPGGIKTRNGFGLTLLTPNVNIVRMARYEIPGAADRLLYLDSAGNLYDSTSGLVILAIATMTDFAMVNLYGRAYISPNNGVEGLANTALYVYDPAVASTARVAGGDPPEGFILTAVSTVAQGIAAVVNNTTPAVGALTLTSSPFLPINPNTIKFTLTVGTSTITAIQITVVGTDAAGAAQTKIYVNPVLSAGPTTKTTAEIWKKITSITINSMTGAAGTGLIKVDTTGQPPGKVEAGYHIFAIAWETASGFVTQPGPIIGTQGNFTAYEVVAGGKAVTISGIPAVPPSGTSKVRILASKLISKTQYTGNPDEYELFFVPPQSGGTIPVGDTSGVINFFDADLVASAEFLKSNFASIPAGVCLISTAKGRLLIGGINSTSAIGGTGINNNTVVWGSKGGEPESFSKTDGFLIVKPGGEGIQNLVEYRDLIYVYKLNRTYVTQDNGGLLSTWDATVVDNAIGSTPHGVALALGSVSSTEDFVLIAAKSGVELFTGTYVDKPLTWKIKELWDSILPNLLYKVEIAVDPINNIIFIIAPIQTTEVDNTVILMGDYKDGLGWETIKWSKWTIAPVIAFQTIVASVTPAVGPLTLTTTPFTPSQIPSAFDFTLIPGTSTITAITITVVGLDALNAPQTVPYVNPVLSAGPLYFTTTEVWNRIDSITINSMTGAAGTGKLLIARTTIADRMEYHSLVTQIDSLGAVIKVAVKANDTFSDDPQKSNGIYEWRANTTHNYSDLIGIRNISAIPNSFDLYPATFSEVDSVAQLSGIRIKLTGEGTVFPIIYGSGYSVTFPLDSFTLPIADNAAILLKSSFVDDDFTFHCDTGNTIGEWMKISRITLFGKTVWSERPSV